MNIIDQIPLCACFVISILLALVCVELGFRLGERQRDANMKDNHAPVGSMIASSIALLAFIMAFTFELAAARYNDRRVMVIDEANAIGTTYRRAEFLEASLRTTVKGLLREYVDLQIKSSSDIRDFIESQPRSALLHDRLWAIGVQVALLHENSPVHALLISSLNEVIDLPLLA